MEVLDSVPGWLQTDIEGFGGERVLFIYRGYDAPIRYKISAREARWMTEEELAALAIELTFGVG